MIRKSFQIIDHSSYASLKTRGGEQFAESAAMYLRLLFFLVTIFKKSSIAAVAGEENGFKRASALAPGVEALLRRLYFIRKCAKKGFIFNGRAGSTRDPLRLCFQTLAHDSQIRLCATFNFVLFKANIFKKSPYFVQIARGRFAALYAILISGSSSGAQIAGAFSKSREVSDLYGRVREVISGKNASSFQSVAYLNTLLINEKILKQAFAGFVSAWGEKYAPVYSASMSEIRGKRAYIKPEVYVNDVADTLHLVPPTITAHEKKEAARFAAKKKR